MRPTSPIASRACRRKPGSNVAQTLLSVPAGAAAREGLESSVVARAGTDKSVCATSVPICVTNGSRAPPEALHYTSPRHSTPDASGRKVPGGSPERETFCSDTDDCCPCSVQRQRQQKRTIPDGKGRPRDRHHDRDRHRNAVRRHHRTSRQPGIGRHRPALRRLQQPRHQRPAPSRARSDAVPAAGRTAPGRRHQITRRSCQFKDQLRPAIAPGQSRTGGAGGPRLRARRLRGRQCPGSTRP